MCTAKVITSTISAWLMAIVYYQIEVYINVEFTPLLYAAIITLGIGLYVGCRDDKKAMKEEA